MVQDIQIIRGDSQDIEGQILRDNTAFDIAGCDIWFTVKTKYNTTDEDDVLFQKTSELSSEISVVDSEKGQILISIKPEDTEDLAIPEFVPPRQHQEYVAQYYYDIQIKTIGGDIYTALRGRFLIVFDVTRSQ